MFGGRLVTPATANICKLKKIHGLPKYCGGGQILCLPLVCDVPVAVPTGAPTTVVFSLQANLEEFISGEFYTLLATATGRAVAEANFYPPLELFQNNCGGFLLEPAVI